MKRLMPASLVLASLLAAASLAVAAPRTVTDPQAPRALQAEGPVSVRWNDPSTFTEIRSSRNRFEAERGNWVEQLARYLRTASAKALQPGQTLEITLVDIERAGDYEPWSGPDTRDVRILRDIYPPRMTLQYTLKAADGQVIHSGEAKLQNTGYLQTGLRLQSNSDPLRYEKELVDQWARGELRTAAGR